MAEAIKKRSFNIPESLYKRLERIADKEDRTVNAQVVRWLEKNVSEYEKRETEPGQRVPATPQVVNAI